MPEGIGYYAGRKGFKYAGDPMSEDLPRGPKQVGPTYEAMVYEKGSTHVPTGSTHTQDGPVHHGDHVQGSSAMHGRSHPLQHAYPLLNDIPRDGSYHGTHPQQAIQTPSRPKPRDRRRGRG